MGRFHFFYERGEMLVLVVKYLGIFYIVLPFSVSRFFAVNLTDGIDGLASISVVIICLPMELFAHNPMMDILQDSAIGWFTGFFVFNHKPGQSCEMSIGGMLNIQSWFHQEWTSMIESSNNSMMRYSNTVVTIQRRTSPFDLIVRKEILDDGRFDLASPSDPSNLYLMEEQLITVQVFLYPKKTLIKVKTQSFHLMKIFITAKWCPLTLA